MKKLIATLICVVVLSMTALPVAAQRRARWTNRQVYNTRPVYDSRYDSRYDNVYNDNYRYDDRSVWNKHRDKITTAGGAVGGALLGGLIGGKKGAIIGAITGGAGAAVYTYKIRDKYRRY
ncbi:MAG TPA: hypothetical protein VMS31_21455 [Pyrinomonadaceae bacterium]|nr:hypothetical protein [Pyrinomonadaceae bacterium]